MEIKTLMGSLEILGEFELTGPIMRVSDPCYERDVWCSGVLNDCVVGTWEAAKSVVDEGPWGERVEALLVRAENCPHGFDDLKELFLEAKDNWSEADFEVGVDSGQAGFYDDAHYQDVHEFDGWPAAANYYGSDWYDHCCEITMKDSAAAGVIPHGVVSCSGYGDGGYYCLYHKNQDGMIDMSIIVFLEEEN